MLCAPYCSVFCLFLFLYVFFFFFFLATRYLFFLSFSMFSFFFTPIIFPRSPPGRLLPARAPRQAHNMPPRRKRKAEEEDEDVDDAGASQSQAPSSQAPSQAQQPLKPETAMELARKLCRFGAHHLCPAPLLSCHSTSTRHHQWVFAPCACLVPQCYSASTPASLSRAPTSRSRSCLSIKRRIAQARYSSRSSA